MAGLRGGVCPASHRTHTSIVIGTIDPTGIADLANAGLYAVEGDWKNAGISLAGAVLPYAGDGLKATRLVKALSKVADGLSHLGAARGVTCRVISATASAGAGALAGAASSFAYGFVNNYIQSGDLGQAWDKGVGGMGWGALQGGLAGGLRGLINPFVCFVAGTQVVTGVKVRREDGRTETISARELAARQQESGGVATKLEIAGYVTRNIEDIVARGGGEMGGGGGQFVVSRAQHDPDGPLAYRRITRTYQRTAYTLQVLTLRDADGVEQTLRVTEEHPFYVQFAGWTAAKSLAAGDIIVGADGTLTVVSNEYEAHPQGVAVYNLEVEDAHTYFVLAAEARDVAAVWVHNANTAYATQARNAKGKFMAKDAAVAMPGMPFQETVLGSLGASRGGMVRATASGKRRFPDLPVGKRFGVTDIKDELALSMSRQLRDYAALAVKNGLPFNVIISSRTQTIARTVQAAVRETGGTILNFDMSTRTWSRVSFASKSNKVIRS